MALSSSNGPFPRVARPQKQEQETMFTNMSAPTLVVRRPPPHLITIQKRTPDSNLLAYKVRFFSLVPFKSVSDKTLQSAVPGFAKTTSKCFYPRQEWSVRFGLLNVSRTEGSRRQSCPRKTLERGIYASVLFRGLSPLYLKAFRVAKCVRSGRGEDQFRHKSERTE